MWRDKSDEGSDHQAQSQGEQRALEAPYAAAGLDADGGDRRLEAEQRDPGRDHGPERRILRSSFGHTHAGFAPFEGTCLTVPLREIPQPLPGLFQGRHPLTERESNEGPT